MPIVSVFCKETRRAGAVNLSACETWETFLAETARLTGLTRVDTVTAISEGDECLVESLEEIDPKDRIEVVGLAIASSPRAGASASTGDQGMSMPSFASDGTALATLVASDEDSRVRRFWRQAVTRVLERQRSPEAATLLLVVMHHASVLAKRSAAKWERMEGGLSGSEAKAAALASPVSLAPDPEDAEALRKAPHAVTFLHNLGYRKPVAVQGAAETLQLDLSPATCASSASASHAVQESLDGRHALARLLAIAADAKAETGTPAGTVQSVSSTALTPASLAAAASAGDEELAAARAEVAELAASAPASSLRPTDRKAVVLPNPRARPPCLVTLSSSNTTPPAVSLASSAAAASGSGVEEEEDEDVAAPQSVAEWSTVERAHRHRIRVARTGVGAVRAERLRQLASAAAESTSASADAITGGAGAGDAAVSPPATDDVIVGSIIQLRLVFPDKVTVVAMFGALESCDALRDTAGACLADQTQRDQIRLCVMRPGGGTKSLRGSSALALAGLRHRGTVSVKLDRDEPLVYTEAVVDAVAAGGACVELT